MNICMSRIIFCKILCTWILGMTYLIAPYCGWESDIGYDVDNQMITVW